GAVVVARALADLPGRGAQRTAQQREEAALLLCVETVFVDTEDGARLQGEDGAVVEADLRASLGARANRIAGAELETRFGRDGLQAGGLGTIDRDFASGGQHAAVGGQRRAREEDDEHQQQACERALHDGRRAPVHLAMVLKSGKWCAPSAACAGSRWGPGWRRCASGSAAAGSTSPCLA